MKILKELNPEDLIFFDIETASVVDKLEIDSPLFDSWAYKKRRGGEDITDEEVVDSYFKEAGLFPEFARIVSIVIGFVRDDKLYLNSYDDLDEKVLLEKFHNDIGLIYANKGKYTKLCGFANKGFDSPFVFKRSIINGVEYHDIFDVGGLKPWELTEVDLKEVWKGTSWNTASLLNIATAFGLPSPKDDISGADVGKVFWKEGVERITEYCKRDVVTTCHIFQKMRGDDKLWEIRKTVKKEKPGILEYLYNGGKYNKKIEDKLEKALKKMSKVDRERAKEILLAIPANTKSRTAFLTKNHIETLCQEK